MDSWALDLSTNNLRRLCLMVKDCKFKIEAQHEYSFSRSHGGMHDIMCKLADAALSQDLSQRHLMIANASGSKAQRLLH